MLHVHVTKQNHCEEVGDLTRGKPKLRENHIFEINLMAQGGEQCRFSIKEEME